MWERILMDKNGVDFIFTNRPVPHTKARNMLQPLEPFTAKANGGGTAKKSRKRE